MQFRLFYFVVIGLFVVPGAVYAQAGWTIDRFDATLTIQSDGSVRVEERLAVDFAALEKHGIYRDLPVVYRDSSGEQTYTRISDIVVEQDGAAATTRVTRNDAMLRIRVGDPDVTLSGEHGYVISYTVLGVLQSFAGYDELYWNVTGNDWEASIERAAARVIVPATIEQGACYVGERGSVDACADGTWTEQEASFAATTLAPGEGLTVAIAFSPGVIPIVVVPPPPTFVDVVGTPVALGTAALVGVVGAGYVFFVWWRFGRDRWWRRAFLPGERSDREGVGELPEQLVPLFRRQPVSVEYDSPDGLRPAEIGVLLDERADTLDVSATIIDLASRGYLRIAEIEKKWFFGAKDYELVRTDQAVSGELRAYERELLSRLFADGSPVKLSDLKNSFYKDLRQVKDLLYQDVVDKHLFAQRPDRVRLVYLGLGFGGLAVGIGLAALAVVWGMHGMAAAWYHSVLAGVGGGVVLSSLAMLGFAPFMSRKTAYGRELYQRSLGYRLFVSGTEKYRAKFYEEQQLFVAVLPYAIMFGVTDQLARAFAAMGVQPPQPSWYQGAAAFNAAQFSSSVASFSTSLSRSMASRPSSSGSGGGGFSGGGFGGGGGGSW